MRLQFSELVKEFDEKFTREKLKQLAARDGITFKQAARMYGQRGGVATARKNRPVKEYLKGREESEKRKAEKIKKEKEQVTFFDNF